MTLLDRLTATLLFAFPLLMVSTEHWASGIFLALALLSLAALRRPQPPLRREECIFLGIVLVYVASTIVSNTLAGWTPGSLRWFEATARILLAVPIYLYLRARPDTVIYLLRAIPIGGVLAGAWVIYVTAIAGERVEGPYGPIFVGNISALLAILSLVTMRQPTWPWRVRVPLHLAGAALALAAVVLSGTRSAWLAAALVAPVVFAMSLQDIPSRRLRVGLLGGAIALAGVVLVTTVAQEPRLTSQRFAVAVEQVQRYAAAETWDERVSAASTSVGIRFEQWRTGLRIFAEHPVIGVGVGNVGPEINRQIEGGLTSPSIAVEDASLRRPVHLHSAYMDALVFKGLVGLVAFLSLLACPAWLAMRRDGRTSAIRYFVAGHVLAFAVFSATEDPFIRNAYSSVFVILLAAGMVALMRDPGPAKAPDGVPPRAGGSRPREAVR